MQRRRNRSVALGSASYPANSWANRPSVDGTPKARARQRLQTAVVEALEQRQLLNGFWWWDAYGNPFWSGSWDDPSQFAFQPSDECGTSGCPCKDGDAGPGKGQQGSNGSQLANTAPGATGSRISGDGKSDNPVNYFTGKPVIASTDLGSAGFGGGWGHTRSWSEPVGDSATGYGINGNGWMVNQLPFAARMDAAADSEYAIVTSASDVRHFDAVTDAFGAITFTPRLFIEDSLAQDSASHLLVFTDSMGNQIRFYDFSANWSAGRQGRFDSYRDASGHAVQASYNSGDQLVRISREDTSGSTNWKESFEYAYYSDGGDTARNGKIQAVTLRRKEWDDPAAEPADADAQIVRVAYYDYYSGSGAGADQYGNAGDLRTGAVTNLAVQKASSGMSRSGSTVTVTLSSHGYRAGDTVVITGASPDFFNGTYVVESVAGDGNSFTYSLHGNAPAGNPSTAGKVNKPFEISYYRYYTSDSSIGYKGGLQYVVNAPSYARLASATSNPMTAASGTLDTYADNYFEYGSAHRVTKETAQGLSCSCAGGRGTLKYQYYVNPRGTALGVQLEKWFLRVTELLPDTTPADDTDNDRWIIYLNEVGDVLLKVFQLADENGYSGQRWGWFTRYDTSGRVTQRGGPSSISFPTSLSTLESQDTILDNEPSDTNSNYFYINDAAGLIETYTYGTSTTATDIAAGDVAGYLKEISIKKGEKGSAKKQQTLDYIAHTATVAGRSVTIYPLSSSTAYLNENGTGAQTTTYSYDEWFANSVQVKQRSVTTPTVTTAQNGPNAAITTQYVYDDYGQLIWTKDGDGVIGRIKYDLGTGGIEQVIVDVDTSQTADEPVNWVSPTASPLHLVSSMEVDGLGRVTKLTDPNNSVTYTVYKDENHEVRIYRGWTSSNTTTGPIEVVREYRPIANAPSGERTIYLETLSSSAVPAQSGNRPTGAETLDYSSIQSLARELTNESGQVIEQIEYFAIPSSYSVGTPKPGSSSNNSSTGNYHSTVFAYDGRGWQARVQSPTGTIVHTFYDGLGRATQIWSGTDDTPSSDLTGDGQIDFRDFRYHVMVNGTAPAGTDMAKTAALQYDFGWTGDGNLTRLTEYPGGSAAARVTDLRYDWRNRKVASKSGVQDWEDTSTQRQLYYYTYDNLGQVTAVEQFDADRVSSADWSAGFLDSDFDGDGKLTADISAGADAGYALAIQPDGRIVIAGKADNEFAVLRYNPNGSLDTSFDGDGYLTTRFSGADEAWAVAIQSDGKIVVAGRSGSDIALARYLTDGSLDDTFDGPSGFGNGAFTIDLGGADAAYAIALQSDGKIVLAGKSASDFAILRLNSNGTLDNTFDTDGKVTVNFSANDEARAIALQSDGKIVVAGKNGNDFAVVRLNTDGSLDNSFDGDGKVTTSIGPIDNAYAVAVQPDGKIVVTGDSGDGTSYAYFALVRYNADGSLDTTFDTDGKVTTDFSSCCGSVVAHAYALTIQGDGKLVAGGDNGAGYFLLARYNTNGSLDTSFHSDGLAHADFDGQYTGSSDSAYAVTTQADGKLVATGVAGTNLIAAARFTGGDGVPDRPAASLLRAKTTYDYDSLGRVYRTTVYNVSQSSGGIGYSLKTNYWYDKRSNLIKLSEPGGLVTKYTYDGAGRQVKVFLSDGGGDPAAGSTGNWDHADDVLGDKVLEQVEYTYDKAGNVTRMARKQRFHDESGTGELASHDIAPKARVSYVGYTYDLANRLLVTLEVGAVAGKATSATSNTLSDTNRSEASSSFVGYTLLITSGTGAGQQRKVTAYNGSTDTFTVDSTWSTTPDATSAYALLPSAAVTGKASSSSANTLSDSARTETTTDYFKDYWIVITSGTGAGQRKQVTSYNGASKTFTVDSNWSTVLDTTSTYALICDGLITNYAYDGAGQLRDKRDPSGSMTRSEYDALGRTKRVIENYVDGSPSADTDRTTEYTYDGADHVLTMKAVLPGATFQTTQYVYGVTKDASNDLGSNDLLKEIRYPDKSTGNPSTLASDRISYTYNALGELKSVTDQNGTVHSYSYDLLGRLQADAVTTLGSYNIDGLPVTVDGTVRRLEFTYDTGGRPEKYTSYDAASGGNIVNQVLREYNGLGQLIREYQAHLGAVDTATSPKVQYAYTVLSGSVNYSRLTQITYPDGRVLRYEYTSGLDDSISRVSFLADDSGGAVGTHLEEYSYLGLDVIIEQNRPQPGVKLTYVKQSGESNGASGDPYIGLDRFGRIIDQRWYKTSTSSNLDRFGYGYDRNSNRTSTDVLGAGNPGNRDEAYFYDALDRLTKINRGSLSGGTIADASAAYSRSWGLDQVGNWGTLTTDSDGGGAGSATTQTKSYNAQNQLTDFDTGSANNEPRFDPAGNLVKDEAGNALRYDAWNRLVSFDGSGTNDKTYKSDALGRRIVETPAGGTARDLYYSANWQVLEEREGSTVKAQNVWGLGYVDALVLRDRDMAVGGGLEERLYAQQDANWNVTSLTDTSGAVVERYQYDPYGSVTVLNPDWSTDSDGSDVAWVYLHQGGRLDAVSGLYHFRNRDYSPTQGRWTQRDPAGYVDGASLYEYVGSSPTGLVDPDGLYHYEGTDPPGSRYRPTPPPPAPNPGPGYDPGISFGGTLCRCAVEELGGDVYDLGKSLYNKDWGGAAWAGGSLVIGKLPGGPAAKKIGKGAKKALEGAKDCAKAANKAKSSLSATKNALKQVHDKVGKLPKGKPGKFGSPQAGNPKKGYRLDPGHPDVTPGSPETGPHINWWDYTGGKRGKGGSSGAVPIED